MSDELASRLTSGMVGLNGAPGKGPKPVTRMRSFSIITTASFFPLPLWKRVPEMQSIEGG